MKTFPGINLELVLPVIPTEALGSPCFSFLARKQRLTERKLFFQVTQLIELQLEPCLFLLFYSHCRALSNKHTETPL